MATNQWYNLWDCLKTGHPYLSWVSDVSGSIYFEERIKNVCSLITSSPMSMSIADFFERVFSKSSPCPQARDNFMTSKAQVGQVLNLISQDPNGSEGLKYWLRKDGYALGLICEDICKEMDAARPDMKLLMKDVDERDIMDFDFNGRITEVLDTKNPTLSKILSTAAQTGRAAAENTKKKPDFVSQPQPINKN